MKTSVQIIAQEINAETGEVINERSVYTKSVERPNNIRDLGFDHEEQMEILQKSQEALLKSQQLMIDAHNSICPNCGKKTVKQGKFKSDFHSVFTDHEITLQRTRCKCNWRSKISVDGIYGSALHPDLAALQSKFGSEMSFKRTEELLAARCYNKRGINNHSRIQKTVQHIGELLLQVKKSVRWCNDAANDLAEAEELILVVDGAHLHSKDTKKRSFEALVATTYNPKNHVKKDKNHNMITKKTVVASAKQDRQVNIKKLILNACLKEGLTKNTQLTVLSDGAKSCWSAAALLTVSYQVLTILDWFHVGKKFKNKEHCVPEELKEDFDGAKWFLWHGNATSSLERLSMIRSKMSNNKKSITDLITYISNNEESIVNYSDRKRSGLVFTSQLSESTVNNLVNERQKQDARMQWSRVGADSILQIRSSVQSHDWDNDWKNVQKLMYREAV